MSDAGAPERRAADVPRATDPPGASSCARTHACACPHRGFRQRPPKRPARTPAQAGTPRSRLLPRHRTDQTQHRPWAPLRGPRRVSLAAPLPAEQAPPPGSSAGFWRPPSAPAPSPPPFPTSASPAPRVTTCLTAPIPGHLALLSKSLRFTLLLSPCRARQTPTSGGRKSPLPPSAHACLARNTGSAQKCHQQS